MKAPASWKRNDWEVTDGEGRRLHELAASVTEGVIVEIGSYRGRSTCWLASGSKAGSRVPVYAVDLWVSGPGVASIAPGHMRERPYAKETTRDAFAKAIRLHGHGLVTPIQGNSTEVAATFEHPVGMLFIDGSHATPDVIADYEAWTPKILPGGLLVFHDVGQKTVQAAMEQTVHADPAWEYLGKVQRVGAFRRANE